MNFKLLLVILVVLVVVVYGVLAVLLVGVPGWGRSPQAGFAAKDAYPQALAEAQAWQGDAQLVSATATWSEPTAEQLLQENTSWGFTFFSQQARQIRIVSVSPQGAESVESVNIPPRVRIVDASSWQVDSPQVLRLFLDHGGRNFLGQHSGASVTLRLGAEEGGQRLVWLAFGTSGAGGSTMTLQVDASNGEVISRAP